MIPPAARNCSTSRLLAWDIGRTFTCGSRARTWTKTRRWLGSRSGPTLQKRIRGCTFWDRRCPARPQLSWLALIVLSLAHAFAAEVIPPVPPNHFNDFAGVVRAETATQLNRELAQFERDTSTQIVAAIYPRMQSESSVDDYTVRVAQRWGVGQRDRRNGAVLFVFQQSRDIRIVTGYGLEGALPDALAKRIIEDEIAPRFRAGDFDGGLTAGVRAMMAAVRGEYRGSGRTSAETGARGRSRGIGQTGITLLVMLAFMILGAVRARSRRNLVYGRRGRRTMWGNGPWIGGGGLGGGGFGGGGWGGGGGGGTFSGGGGSFGGGGAGGKW
jgi:uncharacterized protein